MLAQRIIIKTGKGEITGVMAGAKPPHVLPEDERKKVVEKKEMYIDIGATSQQEVEVAGVRIGDPVVPQAGFAILSNGKSYLAKALDDRVGCALCITTMQSFAKQNHPNTIFGVATVQEEVGCRGATTSADLINRRLAIILEWILPEMYLESSLKSHT